MTKKKIILTDVEERRTDSNWHNEVSFVKSIVGGKGLLSDILAAIRLLLIYWRYDLLILKSDRKGNLFATIKSVLFLPRRPIIMIDCLWYRKSNKLLHAIKRLQIQAVARVVSSFVVWASHEVRDYSTAFGIPQSKLCFLPHHHTLEGFEYQIDDQGYIFSGGDGDRDYVTLLKAAEGLDCTVRVATRLKDWNQHAQIPANVEGGPVTPEEFRYLMAKSSVVVLPMRKGLLHSGGQQTFLNAMALGKIVIVADDWGAIDYIKHGVTGFIVPSGDHVALRNVLVKILTDAKLVTFIKSNLSSFYEEYSTAACMNNILELADSIYSGSEPCDEC